MVHPAPGPVLRPQTEPEPRVAHHLVSHHTAELARAVRAEYYGVGGPGGSGAAASGGGVVVGVVVVSVCVLLGVLVMGVMRLRAAHNRQLREEQEVEMVRELRTITSTDSLFIPSEVLIKIHTIYATETSLGEMNSEFGNPKLTPSCVSGLGRRCSEHHS